nr:substrate-binding domain-containing protein [Neobacillus sp. Marseille-Q6967]
MKKNGLFSLLLGLVMAVLLVGCSSSQGSSGEEKSGDKEIKVGFAIKTQDSPYFVSLVEAVEEYAEAEGWDVTVLDANGDTAKEAENMETFIAQGMDLIFLDSVEPDAAVPSINKAEEAGIGVINLDSGVGEGAKDITTVYSDNKQNGRLVGLTYAEKMGEEEIKAIILSGAKGNVAGTERRTGLFAGIIEGKTGVSEEEAWKQAEAFDKELLSKGKATLAEAKFTVAGQGWGSWTEEEGLTASEDLITANPDLTTVLGENDQMLFGAMTALNNAGIDGVDIVAAADGAKAAYDLIKEGKYFATGENSPYKVAELGVKIAKEILVDGKDMWSYEDITLTEPAAVTKENVDEFYEFGF